MLSSTHIKRLSGGLFLALLMIIIGVERTSASVNAEITYYSIEKALEDPASAGSLILKGQGLEKIPAEIEQLTNLKRLDVSGNSISILPAGIVKLTQLEELDLSNNAFTSIPKEIALIKSLRAVKLGGNQIKDLSGLAGYSGKNLKKLTLHGNEIASLSDSDLQKLNSLEYLSLQGNPLKSIPDAICSFDSLNILIIPNDIMFNTPGCLKYFQEIGPKHQIWNRQHAFNLLNFAGQINASDEGGERGGNQTFISSNQLRLAGNGYYTQEVNYPVGFKKVTPITYVSFVVFYWWNVPRYFISRRYHNRFTYTSLLKLDRKIDRESMSTPMNKDKLNVWEDKKTKKINRLR